MCNFINEKGEQKTEANTYYIQWMEETKDYGSTEGIRITQKPGEAGRKCIICYSIDDIGQF